MRGNLQYPVVGRIRAARCHRIHVIPLLSRRGLKHRGRVVRGQQAQPHRFLKRTVHNQLHRLRTLILLNFKTPGGIPNNGVFICRNLNAHPVGLRVQGNSQYRPARRQRTAGTFTDVEEDFFGELGNAVPDGGEGKIIRIRVGGNDHIARELNLVRIGIRRTAGIEGGLQCQSYRHGRRIKGDFDFDGDAFLDIRLKTRRLRIERIEGAEGDVLLARGNGDGLA